MRKIRRSHERGQADYGWLKTKYSFSFSDYYDPEHMGFSVLRVINEDYIAGGGGFPPHPHRDMEIITYVMEGVLEHKDSMGNTAVMKPGDVQRMSAGTGVRHSEFNHSSTERVHLLQIWLLPQRVGIEPSYGQKSFADRIGQQALTLVASPTAAQGSIAINQDVNLFVGKMKKDQIHELNLSSGRKMWIQVVQGSLQVDDTKLQEGDALAVSDENYFKLMASEENEFLLFDLPQ